MNITALRLVSAGTVCFLSILLTLSALAVPPGSGSLYFVHNDANGTPQALTDEAGEVVWKAQTDPFGTTEVDENPDGDGQTVEFNVRAPGQYHDAETRLHYNYFRYYDPGTGRYLNSDPIGLQGGLNTYSYANANPLLFVDPDGLFGLLFNEFKRGSHRISTQDALVLNQFSNRLAETSTVIAGAGPLAIAGGVGAGVAGKEVINACGKIISRNRDNLRELCKSGLLVGSLIFVDREGNRNPIDDIVRDQRKLEEITRMSGQPRLPGKSLLK